MNDKIVIGKKDVIGFIILAVILGVLGYHFIYLNFFRYRVQYMLGKATIEEALDAYVNPLDEQIDTSLLWDKVQDGTCVFKAGLNGEGNEDLMELLDDDALMSQWKLHEELEAAIAELKEEITCKKSVLAEQYSRDTKRVVDVQIPEEAVNQFIDRVRPLINSNYHLQEVIIDNLKQAGIYSKVREKFFTNLLNSTCRGPIKTTLVFNKDNQVSYYETFIHMKADDGSNYTINLYGPCMGDEHTLDITRSTIYISTEDGRIEGSLYTEGDIIDYKQYCVKSEYIKLSLFLGESEGLYLRYNGDWDGDDREFELKMSLRARAGSDETSTGWSAKGTWSDVVNDSSVTLDVSEGSIWTCKGEQADFAGSISIETKDTDR